MPEVSIESDSIKEALTSAWNDLDGGDYERAVSKFGAVYTGSVETNARVVAAYGAGVAHYHLGDYLAASTWFMTEDEYEKSLRITPKIEDTTENIAYNEAADSLIVRSLYWQAMCLESLGGYGDALVLYQHIVDTYPGQPESVDAFKKIIYLNIAGGRAKAIESMIEERWGTWFGARYDLESAKELYCYALAQLYEYHLEIGDEVKAEKYAKKLQAIVPTEWIDVYRQGHDSYKPTIEDLKRKIELIGKNDAYNKATQLALFDLSILLIEAERFDEATETLMKLKAWPDTLVIKWKIPEISYQLGKVYFDVGSYEKAIEELEWWVSNFVEREEKRRDLAPYVYWLLGLSYENLENYLDAFNSYNHIKDNYPEHHLAGKAWRKIIEYNLRGGRSDDALAAMVEVKAKIAQYPNIYRCSYIFGMLLIYNHYYYYYVPQESDQESDYVRITRSECRFDWPGIVNVWSIECSDEAIEYIKTYTPQSELLPELMFKIGVVLFEDERYDEALERFQEVKRNYAESKFNENNLDEIIQYIEECENKIAGVE